MRQHVFFETQCIYLNFLGTSSLNHFVAGTWPCLLPTHTNGFESARPLHSVVRCPWDDLERVGYYVSSVAGLAWEM